MIFEPLSIEGVFLIKPQKHSDGRGYFCRTFCEQEFRNQQLNYSFVQQSISFNSSKGTVRGLHFQSSPYEEVKVVRCISGKIFDVVVDLRKESKTFGAYLSFELNSDNAWSVYVPKGLAHGFQTLTNDTTLHYMMSENYSDIHAKGVRWNDKDIGVNWPIVAKAISEKDKALPLLKEL